VQLRLGSPSDVDAVTDSAESTGAERNMRSIPALDVDAPTVNAPPMLAAETRVEVGFD